MVIPTGTRELTVSFWIKNWVDGYVMRWVPSNLHFWESATTSTEFEATVENNALKFLLAQTTDWSLLVTVFDTTGATLYKDGVVLASSTTAKIPAAGFEQEADKDAGIFCNPISATTGHNFHGDLKDLRFYTTAFTAKEVLELYYLSEVSCTRNSDPQQVTLAYHPDWTEILFVRAPKTSEEKWVRMSRSQWDAIAGEDYGGGWVDAPILAAYPATTATTARVYKRHDTFETNGGGTPWIYAPTGLSGQVALNADTAIHAQYEPTSYARNGQWYDRINDPANPYPILDTEFQVFVRAPTWQDHYVGCLDTSGGDPPGYNLGQISSVNTFVDALLICSNYEGIRKKRRLLDEIPYPHLPSKGSQLRDGRGGAQRSHPQSRTE